MSILLNGKIGAKIPGIDPRIKHKLFFSSTCELSEDLINLFKCSFWAVAEQLEEENLLEDEKAIAYLTCITIDTDEFTIKLDDNQMGMITSLAVYPVHKWINLNRISIYVSIIEELCHHYWRIRDEVEVNFKVLEVLKRIFPNIKMSDIYNTEWMNEELKKQGKEPIKFL